MSARWIVLGVAIATWLAACAPEVRTTDGYYSCVRGACPDVAPICGTDGRCHTTVAGPDAAAPDASIDASAIDADVPIDAPMPGNYLPCNPGSCPLPDVCLGAGPDGEGPGYCSPPCAGGTGCGTPELVCADDAQCRVTCESSSDCPAGMACLRVYGGGTEMSKTSY